MNRQSAFCVGLLTPQQPAPDGLQNAGGSPSGKRYDVYRNNVTHALISALNTAFPLVHRLIGSERFGRIAPEFVRAHPPSSPVMMFYGAEFPGFLTNYAPLSDIGYLPDAARLDLAMRHAYHAADAPRLDPAQLQAFATDDLMTTRFALAPATHILRSDWPLYDIWRVTFQNDAPKPRPIAQDVLITRPDFDPALHLLPSGGASWLTALAEGNTFAQAHERAIAQHADFDLEATLTLALHTAALTNSTTRT